MQGEIEHHVKNYTLLSILDILSDMSVEPPENFPEWLNTDEEFEDE